MDDEKKKDEKIEKIEKPEKISPSLKKDGEADRVSADNKKVYTHGKIFEIPAKQSLESFLREKYPEEYKKEGEK